MLYISPEVRITKVRTGVGVTVVTTIAQALVFQVPKDRPRLQRALPRHDTALFPRPVLGCIDADLCK